MRDDFDNDQELESYLSSIRGLSPSAKQIEDWKNALRKEIRNHNRSVSKKRRLFEICAACIVGILIGAAMQSPTRTELDKNFYDDGATQVRVFHKSN